MKTNMYRRLLNKNRRHEIEIGSKEDYVMYMINRAYEYEEYCDSEETSTWKYFRSLMNSCQTIDEMEDEIVGFSLDDNGWTNEWKQERIIDYYELKKQNDRIKLEERLEHIDDFYNYAKRANYDYRVMNDEMGTRLFILFTDFFIDKDIFREYKDYFNKWESEYEDKGWGIHHSKLDDYDDKYIKLFKRNIEELKKSNIDFKFDTYKLYWED